MKDNYNNHNLRLRYILINDDIGTKRYRSPPKRNKSPKRYRSPTRIQKQISPTRIQKPTSPTRIHKPISPTRSKTKKTKK